MNSQVDKRAACRAIASPASRGLSGSRWPWFEASFEAAGHLQDAPRTSSANKRLRASTRLARANRLCSCALFLARLW